MSATYFFLTIQNDRVVVEYAGTHGGQVTRVIRDWTDFRQFITSKAAEAGVRVQDLQVVGSSTLDFSEEYTKNKETIVLAKQIGGVVDVES